MSTTTTELRIHLRTLLGNGHAHMGFDDAVRNFPLDRINDHAPNVPYTPWHLLEHMRLTQRDSLDYMRDANYTAPEWPAGFWPDESATADESAWNATIESFRRDHADYVAIVNDDSLDLSAPIPSNPHHTLLRSIMIIAAHNHYHTGEFAILRQVMGTWPADHD